MSRILKLLCLCYLTCIVGLQAFSQGQPGSEPLINLVTGKVLEPDTRNLVILFHGWNPTKMGNSYTNTYWAELTDKLLQAFERPSVEKWALLPYRWEDAAATGFIWEGSPPSFFFANATQAARNARDEAETLVPKLPKSLRKVHLIAHSAGSWAARDTTERLLRANPYVVIQLTLLDPFIPGGRFSLFSGSQALNVTAMESLAQVQGASRIWSLENYYADDSVSSLNPLTFEFPTLNTQFNFDWRSRGSSYLIAVPRFLSYDFHSGPIRYYADTVSLMLAPNEPHPPGLFGASVRLLEAGWRRSMHTESSAMPRFTTQPRSSNVSLGTAIQLTAVALRAHQYRWFKDGLPIGIEESTHSFTVNGTNIGTYVLQAVGQFGTVFSDAAVISLQAPPPRSSFALNASSGPNGGISPAGIVNIPRDGTAQFTATPNSGYAVDAWYHLGRALAGKGTTIQIQNVQSEGTVNVTFRPLASTPSPGQIGVSIQPPEAIQAGAQWRIGEEPFRVTDSPRTGLAPGTYRISFKPVPGFQTPEDRTIDLAAGQTQSLSTTYLPSPPSLFSLSLNFDESKGWIETRPIGSGTERFRTFPVGTAVRLTAYSKFGYRFTGWTGSAGGNAISTRVVMDQDHTVEATFADGDPDRGTVSVTILPPEAAAAGVTWGRNSTEFLTSGTLVSMWKGEYYLDIHAVDGWLGPSHASARIEGLAHTGLTVTFERDLTPGKLTVALEPAAAVAAGARWRIDGGQPQVSGSTITLPPGSNYVLSFDTPPGWSAPEPRQVTVSRALTTHVPITLSPPPDKPFIALIQPSFGGLAGGTRVTITGANFAPDSSVLFGGTLAPAILVRNSSLIECTVPSATEFGSAAVTVRGSAGEGVMSNGFAYVNEGSTGFDIVSSIGGVADGLALSGDRAYLGQGLSLVVLDISNPSGAIPIARVPLPGRPRSIAISGSVAYLAAGPAGLVCVDISDPSNPRLKGAYTAEVTRASGVEVRGGRAYVIDSLTGLHILDLTSRFAPKLVSRLPLSNIPVGIIVHVTNQGVLALIATGGNLEVVDVSNPQTPRMISRLNLGQSVYSLAASGNLIAAAAYQDGLKLISIANPTNPTVVAHDSDHGCLPTAVSFAGNILVTGNAFISGHRTYQIDGTSLSLLSSGPNIGAFSTALRIHNGRSYWAAGSKGLIVYTLQNPFNPTHLYTFDDGRSLGNISLVAMSGSNAFIQRNSDVALLKFQQSNNPQLKGIIDGSGSYLVGRGDVAYIGNEIIAADAAGSLSRVGIIPTGLRFGSAAAFAGQNLLIAGIGSENRLFMSELNISNPQSPILLATHGLGTGIGSIERIVRSADRGMVVWYGAGGSHIQSIRLTSSRVTAIDTPFRIDHPFTAGAELTEDGRFAFVLNSESPTYLQVLDLATQGSPTKIATILLDRLGNIGGKGLVRIGNELIVGLSHETLAFDISRPAAPRLVRSAPISGGPMSVSGTDASSILVATGYDGLAVLRLKDQESPVVQILNPSFGGTYETDQSTVTVGGIASDNNEVIRVVWTSSTGHSGLADGTADWVARAIPLAVGTNLITMVAQDASGNSGTNLVSIVFKSKLATQSISLAALIDRQYTEKPIPLAATASSGLPVAFSVAEGPARVVDGHLVLSGAGIVRIVGSQSGNQSFLPAPPVEVSFLVTKAQQTIEWDVLPAIEVGSLPVSFEARSSSGMPVRYRVVAGDAFWEGNALVVHRPGSVTLEASQEGDHRYSSAAPIIRTIQFLHQSQAIYFPHLTRRVFGDAPFTVHASASSGLPVTLTVLAGPAQLDGSVMTITGVGMVVLRAVQEGNDLFEPAPTVDRTLIVAAGNNFFESPEELTDGLVQLRYRGTPGRKAVLERTSDLWHWVPISTNVLGGNGIWDQIVDVSGNEHATQYRVILP
jgi:hypothetical protein